MKPALFSIFLAIASILNANAAPIIAAGQYRDPTDTRRPLLALSQDSGLSWSFPASINAPLFTPDNPHPFTEDGIIASTSCNNSLCILSGLYADKNNTYRPLLALSRDSGTTWSYPASINNPVFIPENINPFAQTGMLTGSTCNSSLCIATGQYADKKRIVRPLLVLSNDSGTSWTYPASITAPLFTPNNQHPFASDGSFMGTSCSESLCIAVGQYNDKRYTIRPLLALSKDSGNSWVYPASVTAPVFTAGNPNPFETDGALNSASCTGTTCIAVGDYMDSNAITRPLLALSQDSGNSWIYPAAINNPVFTPENSNPFAGDGFFNSASCHGSRCIAAGLYRDNEQVIRPLLALSNDSGGTWSYPESINAPAFTPGNPNPFAHTGIFIGSTCNAITCTAVGYYFDTNNVSRPLLATSHDSGVNWTYPAAITKPEFITHPFANNGVFNTVSCNENTCIAAGQYTDPNNIGRPLLALSQDSGATWTYPPAINAPEFTPENPNPFARNGSFNNASVP